MQLLNRSNVLRLVLVLILCGMLIGQQTPVQQTQVPASPKQEEPAEDLIFRGGVNYVSTPALVLDRDGNYVNGLEQKDFRLYDNGKLQNVTVDVTFIPISLVILIQANSQVQHYLPSVAKIGNLIQPLLIGDQGLAAVIAYDGRVRTLQEFTSDSDKITKAVKSITPGSNSNRLVDSVEAAARMLRNQPKNRRRVILQIGETRDIASEARVKETLIALQHQNIQYFGVDMGRFLSTLTAPPKVGRPDNLPPAMRGPLPMGQASTPTTIAQAYGQNAGKMEFVPVMVEVFRDVKAVFKANPVEVFTKGTGGSEFGFHSQRSLESAIQELGDTLHSGYFLTYSPNNMGDGGFHEIKVEIPTRADVKKVVTRPGYWFAPKFN